MICFWKKIPFWMYFGQGQDFKQTTELSEKVQYSRNQATAVASIRTTEALASVISFTFVVYSHYKHP